MSVEQRNKICFIAASVLLAAMLQIKPEWFIYSKFEMISQPWRFFTAHWVHVGWMHYFLNMIAFVCLPFIFPKIKTSILLILVILLPLLISLIFYCFYPNIELYAGFSGVLHGLYCMAALISLTDHKERGFAVLILFGLMIKLLWEAIVGELSATARLIGSPVLIEAHQLGVGISLVLFIILMIYKKKKLKVDFLK
ncbi:rhombosortase [Acinetobacter populi]|uniref:Rhombosortase n=2 Tax=Acinetobacter populi TaxID=1582270 RepID=A0A1Z9YX62_9GAMM|nr:rhombosortase [Acinetobacter populi]